MPGRGRGRKRPKNRPRRINNAVRGVGNDTMAPRVLGSQQIQTQIKMKDQVVLRAFTGIVNLTTSAISGGNLVFNIATNTLMYNTVVGTSTNAATADSTNFAGQFEYYKIKLVEVVWNPLLASTTVIPPLYSAYDAASTDTDFGSTNIAGVVNYNNKVRFDPRMGTSWTIRNKAPASTSVAPNVLSGGWQPTSVINNFGTDAAWTGPGVITIQGSGLGQSLLIGRAEVTYKVAFKGYK